MSSNQATKTIQFYSEAQNICNLLKLLLSMANRLKNRIKF